ncbi:MAG: acetoacetate--CoA ligase [Acidimicrobiia bacterium]|nr:acetoacetate--CoA ligase [Acidimicrobiia bacterium]
MYRDITEGTVLWEPSPEERRDAKLTEFSNWLARSHGKTFGDYSALWEWSVSDLEGFWGAVWEYFGIESSYERVLSGRDMPGVRWFEGARLNYAERALSRRDDHLAVIATDELGVRREVTYAALADQVAAAAAGLRRLGVGMGDRVAALMPNIPETLVAFLATASLGAVWSSCSPEFGIGAVAHRFEQIEPKVLLAVDGYRFGGKMFDRLEIVEELAARLPSLEATVILNRIGTRRPSSTLGWEEFTSHPEPLRFEPVPFDHPLWVLYSSGTTGLPKPIVHSQGGILLQHLKDLVFHMNLGEDDRFFWYTSTGWMMWNLLVSGLQVGATIILYDGSPGYPDLSALWQMAERLELTYFGTSAPFIHACLKADLHPGSQYDLSHLRSVGSTGAPLTPDGFAWVYDRVHDDLLLGSISGGTDLCAAFIGSCPVLPVKAGEIQCRYLGARVESYDVLGKPIIDEVGELVITAPMPSMPIYFWNDPDGSKYRASYFEMYPGVWRHGDWIKVTSDGGCVVSGRSDSTLNRGGVRTGTSEFYRVVDSFTEIEDSLVIDTGALGREDRLLLFVALKAGFTMNADLQDRLRSKIRSEISPRHVPDEIHRIPDIPRTLNGKKMEVPVKRIIGGVAIEQAARLDAMANPASLEAFVQWAAERRDQQGEREY